jgi:hypothetical protein
VSHSPLIVSVGVLQRNKRINRPFIHSNGLVHMVLEAEKYLDCS